jgi:CRP-like cAMP-binding protein
MDKTNLVNFILNVLPMSPVKAAQIADNYRQKKVLKNGYVLKEGEICNAIYFVASGLLRAYTYDVDGNDVTTAFYPENTSAGDIFAFFKRLPSKEYVQAVTDCETWYMSYDEMQTNFHTIPEFRDFGRLNIINNYGILKQRMLSMLQETAEQRYVNLMNSHPGILQVAPLKHIATYLGITDTSLSRIRKEIVKK